MTCLSTNFKASARAARALRPFGCNSGAYTDAACSIGLSHVSYYRWRKDLESEDERLPKTVHPADRALSRTAKTPQIKAEVRRLEDAAPDLAVEDELLVKIGVRGFEDRVIRGGLESLRHAVTSIVQNCSAALYRGQANSQEDCALLTRIGLRFEPCLEKFFRPNGIWLDLEAAFLRSRAA